MSTYAQEKKKKVKHQRIKKEKENLKQRYSCGIPKEGMMLHTTFPQVFARCLSRQLKGVSMLVILQDKIKNKKQAIITIHIATIKKATSFSKLEMKFFKHSPTHSQTNPNLKLFLIKHTQICRGFRLFTATQGQKPMKVKGINPLPHPTEVISKLI